MAHNAFARRLVVVVALTTIGALAAPRPASAGVIFSINVVPPPLPVYVQPITPGPNYIWAPGYWAYDDADGYFWVPGTWVRAPQVGLLWTPGYWGWSDGYYVWHAGYWGPHIGFYGGVNYGCGYTGSGYWGGHWDHGAFFYNTSVTRVNTTIIHNTYNTVVVNNNIQRVSFNGGTGGITASPTPAEVQAGQEHHFAPTAMQTQHQHAASTNKALFASVNHGAPTIAATSKPGVFTGHGVMAAKMAKTIKPGGQAPNTNAPHLTSANPQGVTAGSPGSKQGVDAVNATRVSKPLAGTGNAQPHPKTLAHAHPHPKPAKMAANRHQAPHKKPEHG